MTLLSLRPGHAAYNANLLRLNFARIEEAMGVLVPETGEPKRLYRTRARLPMLGGAVLLQYSRAIVNDQIQIQTAELKTTLGSDVARIAFADIRYDDGRKMQCNTLTVWNREPLQASDGEPLDGFAVDIDTHGDHTLVGLRSGQDIPLPSADLHHADDLAVTGICILESRAVT